MHEDMLEAADGTVTAPSTLRGLRGLHIALRVEGFAEREALLVVADVIVAREGGV